MQIIRDYTIDTEHNWTNNYVSLENVKRIDSFGARELAYSILFANCTIKLTDA